MLANQLWNDLESRWGPHTVDLMSLDSNVHSNPHSKSLRRFTPWPTPNSAGVNLSTQTLQVTDNADVFPPFGADLQLSFPIFFHAAFGGLWSMGAT